MDVEGPTPGSGSRFAGIAVGGPIVRMGLVLKSGSKSAGVLTERAAMALEGGGVGIWCVTGTEILGSGPAECPGTMIVGTLLGVAVVVVPVISLI
jgi:hypothetical protein